MLAAIVILRVAFGSIIAMGVPIWSYGQPGEELIVRDIGDVRLLA